MGCGSNETQKSINFWREKGSQPPKNPFATHKSFCAVVIKRHLNIVCVSAHCFFYSKLQNAEREMNEEKEEEQKISSTSYSEVLIKEINN